MKSLFCTLAIIFATVATYAQTIKGTYAIKNVSSGMVLRIKDANTANGTPIVPYSPVNWKCVTWDFKNIEGQAYQLKNLFSGKTLQAKTAAAEGVSLEEQPIAGQQYEFLPGEKNSYLIRVKGTELYITQGEDNIVLTGKKKDNKSQSWTLVEQHPTM
ncbi:RICIN domain-containing protein [Chitinophaga sancti]|uniref:RICIN domain-containing protein n=1 Tax=Chitinophaga sancti TaxID=1004 RepID=UPI003F79455F